MNSVVVITCTYNRPNGKTREYLSKCFEMLKNQTYQSFDYILSGDHFEPYDELVDISKNFYDPNKLIRLNTDISVRDMNLPIRKNDKRYNFIWHYGGMHGLHHGIKYAMGKYKYYIHLDDDDLWTPDHIELIIKKFHETNVDFCLTCGIHKDCGVLPKITENKINNYIPATSTSIHSTWAFDLETIGKYIIEYNEQLFKKLSDYEQRKLCLRKLTPYDAGFLDILKILMENQKITTYAINKITMPFHDEYHF